MFTLIILVLYSFQIYNCQFIDENSKVKVDIYYETLCPDSKYFIRSQVTPTFKSIGDIMNLNLIPFGKAKFFENSDGVHFNCHHGINECEGNIIQSCAIHLLNNNMTKIIPFIDCMESYRRSNEAGEICAKETGIIYGPIKRCADSGQGSALHLANGKMTKALTPTLTFVPWIIINGVYTETNQQTALYGDFKKLICDNYKGPFLAGCL